MLIILLLITIAMVMITISLLPTLVSLIPILILRPIPLLTLSLLRLLDSNFPGNPLWT